MKSIDKLPEKWCIRLTEENQEIVGAYFNESANVRGDKCYRSEWTGHYLRSHDYRGRYVMDGSCDANFAEALIPKGYTEISFEDFKTWVLGMDKVYEEETYQIF